jgi:TM2 domain-containing membrane protein YozV
MTDINKPAKDKTVAVLLAFFFGGFGVHRFYLGQTGTGILFLLFFWTFIPAIIAIIDIVKYLTMSDEKWSEYVERASK